MPAAAVAPLLAALRASPPDAPIGALRAALAALAAGFAPPPGVREEPARVGGVPGAWLVAETADPERTVLHVHGGAYVLGSVATHRELLGRLAAASGARVLGIDYRLAPEHRFPAALEDVLAAWRALVSGGARPERSVLSGDSAGGGLVVAALAALRDAGEPLPAAAVVMSPWVDLTGTAASLRDPARRERDWLHPDALARFAREYLGPGGDPSAPAASPLFAKLGGLPPLLVQVGGGEILHDDATRLVERVRAAGGTAELDTWPELFHWLQLFASALPEGARAIERAGAFVRAHTGGAA